MQDQSGERQRIRFVDLGLLEYGRCWDLQKNLHARVAANTLPPTVLLVEHPPVLTLGKHAKQENLKYKEEFFRSQGVGVFQIDRGGEVTAHEPGQLVCYPILRLPEFELAPKIYVSLLEAAVIKTLTEFGIAAHVEDEFPGVWVGRDKICAIGVRIKERASMHGLAFNIANDLALFERIIPCGIQGRGVTTLSRLLNRKISLSEVMPKFCRQLLDLLVERNAAYDSGEPLQCRGEDFIISV